MNAGKITGEAYYPDFTKTRKELNELRVKWGQVSPKMGVQFVFDYRQRSDRQIATLRGQYAPKPVEKPKEIAKSVEKPVEKPAPEKPRLKPDEVAALLARSKTDAPAAARQSPVSA